ncbi:MAG: Ni/Fe hydrogenase subunit alpha [Actinomycetota bacterium]
MSSTERTVRTKALGRVEGEGGMEVRVADGRVVDVRLEIYEPPRFFEALLRGRHFTEPVDITARICGICPVAYQMSAIQAMEGLCEVDVGPGIRALRRLLYCGEWIESHALHVYMLHAPDFLGYAGGVEMARDHRDVVARGLRLKKIGNAVMSVVGGRSVHPINVRVGGFFRAPTKAELGALLDELRWARDASLETVRWVSAFDFPDFDEDYEFVSLRHPTDYPVTEGRIVSNRGIDIDVDEYDEHFEEFHVEHSNALHSRVTARGGPYMVGPLARYSLNADRLWPLARGAARDAGLGNTCTNPFRSIVVRAVELVQAADECVSIVEGYEPPDPAWLDVQPRTGTGRGATEAPRGLLYHRYSIDADGVIADAKIVPPTSQNQTQIERDLGRFVEANLSLSEDDLTWESEQMIRNYDPCISCATHFLTIRIVEA